MSLSIRQSIHVILHSSLYLLSRYSIKSMPFRAVNRQLRIWTYIYVEFFRTLTLAAPFALVIITNNKVSFILWVCSVKSITEIFIFSTLSILYRYCVYDVSIFVIKSFIRTYLSDHYLVIKIHY